MSGITTTTRWWQRILAPERSPSDERSRAAQVANNLVLHLHPVHVPAQALRFTYTWGLGGISALLLAILGITGLLLVFRYDARVNYAYSSIQQMETQVMFGSLVRSLHHWSANLLVITVFLHLVRVFLTGSYKQGRRSNWFIGVALLLLALAANFTGYLLPWDQLSYWAITVSTNLLSYIPWVGIQISRFILAGPEVGQPALSNFYAFHIVFLPLLMTVFMGYHFWKIRKNGGISQPLRSSQERNERVTTLPHLVSREAAVAALVGTVLLLYAMSVAAPLGTIADPFHSPNPAKAAWYFLGLQELLLHMHPIAAIGLVAAVLAGLFFLPLIDKHENDIGLYFRSPAGKRCAFLGALIGLDLIPILVLLDEFWIDLPAWLPGLPVEISSGLLPLLASLAGLALLYTLLRVLVSYQGSRANHSEALVGVFSFLVTSLVILTIVGVFFRGENMALVLPF
jgi:quinol-cytochrome oxidoreductase complex cytochrome b subunit